MSLQVTQQVPPAVTITQDSFVTNSTSHGAIGPVIAVLVVIMVLGIIAVMIGRVCSGRRIFGYGQYDIESWAEAHCGACIDGRLTPPRPPAPPPPPPSSMAVPAPQSHPEIKNEDEEEEEQHHHHRPPENH
ncbi:hypothetical protein M5689_016626 [Euphorbia peplus]|nr:hypothetical protein M5689_016626 [Euphorbia peplus]